jgi:hypothetical protein
MSEDNTAAVFYVILIVILVLFALWATGYF